MTNKNTKDLEKIFENRGYIDACKKDNIDYEIVYIPALVTYSTDKKIKGIYTLNTNDLSCFTKDDVHNIFKNK